MGGRTKEEANVYLGQPDAGVRALRRQSKESLITAFGPLPLGPQEG